MVTREIEYNGETREIGSKAELVTYSGNVLGSNNVKDALEALQHAVETGAGGAGNMSQYGYFGINFPKQMSVIRGVLDAEKNNDHPRLRFIHVSDSHGSDIGNADSLLENTAADFAVHTGDAMVDSWNSSIDTWNTLKGKMLACSKPFFFTIGNHDCYKSPSLAARYGRYIQPFAEHNGLEDDGKTYYKVDITKGTALFKCIFLDQQDNGYTGSESPTNWATGNMTDEQVIWLINQLQEAATNSRHVLIFAHVQVGTTTRTTQMDGWFDFNEYGCVNIQNMLMDIVDAFINKSTYTYKGTDYTFSKKGIFVGWFFGHTHHDCYGRISGHENQFKNVTCRPYSNSDAYDGTFRSGYPRINYFTVDAADRKVSLYRVGEQRTWQGTERVSFYYKY